MYRPTRLQTSLAMRGIGMIEVLVTLLIISVGFLSMAGLQTVAKRSNFDAVQRTTAVILAQDILEKMRANPLSLEEYLTSAAGLGGGTLTEPTQACSSAERCNTAQLAAYDQWLWEQSIDGATETRMLDGATTETGGLSEPTGCVSGPAAGGAGLYSVTIVWRGLSELTNISDNECGAGSGNYGDADQFRRILEIQVYIAS
ncbi:MAG: type IV pilus modification protein PilV [Pseudomonadota bacterium]